MVVLGVAVLILLTVLVKLTLLLILEEGCAEPRPKIHETSPSTVSVRSWLVVRLSATCLAVF